METNLHRSLAEVQEVGDFPRIQFFDVAEHQDDAVGLRQGTNFFQHYLLDLALSEELVDGEPERPGGLDAAVVLVEFRQQIVDRLLGLALPRANFIRQALTVMRCSQVPIPERPSNRSRFWKALKKDS